MIVAAAAVVGASEDLFAVDAVVAVPAVVEADTPLIGTPSYPLCVDDATAAAAAAAMSGTNVGILRPWVYVSYTVRPALD